MSSRTQYGSDDPRPRYRYDGNDEARHNRRRDDETPYDEPRHYQADHADGQDSTRQHNHLYRNTTCANERMAPRTRHRRYDSGVSFLDPSDAGPWAPPRDRDHGNDADSTWAPTTTYASNTTSNRSSLNRLETDLKECQERASKADDLEQENEKLKIEIESVRKDFEEYQKDYDVPRQDYDAVRHQLAKSLSDSGNHDSAIKLYNDLIEEQTASSRASDGRTERRSFKPSDLLLDLRSGLAAALAASSRYGDAAQIFGDVLYHRQNNDPIFDGAATQQTFDDYCNSLIKQDTPTSLRDARNLLHQQSLSVSRTHHDGNANLGWALDNSVRLVEVSLKEREYHRVVQDTYFICLHRHRAEFEASSIEKHVRGIVQSLLAQGRKDHALHVLCHWSGASADSGKCLTDCIRDLDSAKIQELLGHRTRTLKGLEIVDWRDLGWELSLVLLKTERYNDVNAALTKLPKLPKDTTGGPTKDQVRDLQLHCQLRTNGRASFADYDEIAQTALGLFNKYGFATTIPASAAPDVSPAETLITTLQRMVEVADATVDPYATFTQIKEGYWKPLFQRAKNDHSNTAMMRKLSEFGDALSKKWTTWRKMTGQRKSTVGPSVAEEARMVKGWAASSARR